MEKEVEAKAKKMSPDDPILAQHAVQALIGRYNQDKYARRQEELVNLEIVASKIKDGVRDVSELRADPQAAAAMDALPRAKALAIPGQINRYNAAKNQETNQENYQKLWGLANNDVEAFLNTDLTKEQLSQADMRKLQAQQQKIREVPMQDPRVNRAIGQIRGAMGSQLEALHIYKRDAGNKDEYDRFTGAVQTAIDVWTTENGKAPMPKDVIETIGPQVIKQISEPGRLFGTNEVPFFNQAVPRTFSDKIKADVVKQGGREPDENEIRKAYMRTQFIKLYGKKEAK